LKIFKYIYENIFGFLFNFKKLKSLDDDGLQNKCLNLEGFLKHDLDGLDLFSKLKVLKEILQIEESTPIGILNYVKRLDSFPNACIAYRILLTIPITVASIERSFSKLKLIKFYLRSTMSQGKLNRLAILSIEKKKMLENLEYKNLIRNFASQKARITNFK
jgi:hypothetical protein